MTPIEVTRTYLEMTDPAQRHPARDAAAEAGGLRIERMESVPASFYRYLYAEVGRDYHWVDRLAWSDHEIREHLAQAGLSVWLMSFRAAPAGYFELARGADESTEIAYFGLLPDFHGRGWGKHLLTVATEEAWKGGARRVWLHTCTLDHPGALPNYRARGFVPYKTENYWTER